MSGRTKRRAARGVASHPGGAQGPNREGTNMPVVGPSVKRRRDEAIAVAGAGAMIEARSFQKGGGS